MSWKGKKVLVTGAAGFAGSHLVELLLREGAQVRGFVRYNSRGNIGFLDGLADEHADQLEIVAGDVTSEDSVRQSMKDVQVVFHLAALVGIPYSYVHPDEVVATNLGGTLNILLAARDEGVDRVVHTSTSEVYGSARKLPIDEDHPLQPQSPYSASKIGADSLALSFFYSFDLPVAILRPFNMFGPRQSARAVIPTIIMQALVRDHVKLGVTETTRDFTLVEDTAKAFLAMGDHPDAVGQVINAGSGREISIGDLAQTIIERIGRDVKVVTDESRVRPAKSEVSRLLSDSSKAERVLGWTPDHTLEQGLDRTIEYMKAHMDEYDPDRYVV